MEERLSDIRKTDPKKFALFTGRDQMQALTGLFPINFGTPNYATHGGFCSMNMASGMIYTLGGSFNTRDIFHGVSSVFFKPIKWIFLALVFPVTVLLLLSGLMLESIVLIAAVFAVQYIGLIAERWFFIAQANHPQNLYYQKIS